MPRKNLIRTSEYFYHITTRSNHKEWFDIPLDYVWIIAIKSFKKAQKNNPAKISQFVLMANHYHLLIRTPNNDIDQFMYHFNKTFSDLLRIASNKENRMFGSNYKWSLIKNHRYFHNVFRYIYQNPLRAGITEQCENYPYSTLHYTSNNIETPFDFTKLDQLESNLSFINEKLDFEKSNQIKKGLRKSIFKEVKKRNY
jgi:putative transposase